MVRKIRSVSRDTRDLFIEEARRQFAEKGFYGTSIASIADALGLTKQALLHHFGTKEKLYGEVLQQISERMIGSIIAAQAEAGEPQTQLENVLLGLCQDGIRDPQSTQLIMRELLDNKRRAKHAGTWYLKPFLDGLVALARRVPAQEYKSEVALLSMVYQLLGAVNYFLVSEPTLKQMFGKAQYDEMKMLYPDEFKTLIRARLAAK